MPLTEAGIYYADTSTTMSIADITAAMATSMGSSLNVLQVKTFTDNQNRSTASTTFVDSGISVSFTPKYANSTIYVYAYFLGYVLNTNAITMTLGEFQLTDASNATLQGAEYSRIGYYDAQAAVGREHYAPVSLLGVVAAGSTSARTYKLRFRATSNVTVNVRGGDVVSRIVIQEVAA